MAYPSPPPPRGSDLPPPPPPGGGGRETEEPVYQEISEKRRPPGTDTAGTSCKAAAIVYGHITAKQVAKFVPCTQTAIVR